MGDIGHDQCAHHPMVSWSHGTNHTANPWPPLLVLDTYRLQGDLPYARDDWMLRCLQEVNINF